MPSLAPAVALRRRHAPLLVAALLGLTSPPARGQAVPVDYRQEHARALVDLPDDGGDLHDAVGRRLSPWVGDGRLIRMRVGRSAQGRPLAGYVSGDGPQRVLFWSQTDGDASIGTRALVDLLAYLAEEPGTPLQRLLRERLSVIALPLVNPDGAAAGSSRNAQGLEILLDGRRQASAEGRALTQLARDVPTMIAVGLEDAAQGDGSVSAASLWVPDGNPLVGGSDARGRALRAGGHLASMLGTHPGLSIARVERPFDPRSIPDLLQDEIRSTIVLGVSGAGADEPELRRSVFAALLSLLHGVAVGGIAEEAAGPLAGLPGLASAAGPREIDALIAAARIRVPGVPAFAGDVALTFDDPINRTGARVVDLGDLDVVAQDTIAASKLTVSFLSGGGELLIGDADEPAAFDVYRRRPLYRARIYSMRNGTLAQPQDHRFPPRARWYISLQPPFFAQELSQQHEDVALAFREVGWLDPADGVPAPGISRQRSAFHMAAGRTLTRGIAVELAGGVADGWTTSGWRGAEGSVALESQAMYAAALASYELRGIRVAAGPGVVRESWQWVGVGSTGSAGSGSAPGYLWEASVALPAGTSWAPELRIQQRSFAAVDVGGFGDVVRMRMRHHALTVGLGVTARWWKHP